MAAFDEHCVSAGYKGGIEIDYDSTGYEGFCIRFGASGADEITI